MYYCSRKCQKNDWYAGHKFECKKQTDLNEFCEFITAEKNQETGYNLTNFTKLCYRIAIKVKYNDGQELFGKLPDGRKLRFEDMEEVKNSLFLSKWEETFDLGNFYISFKEMKSAFDKVFMIIMHGN